MKTLPPETANGLKEGYLQLAYHYEQALQVAARLSSMFKDGSQPDDELKQLATIMSQVEQIEQTISPLKQQWLAAGKPTTAEFQDAVVRVRKSLEQLITSIALAEQQAQTAKQKLSPKLTAQTLSHRMQAAYAASSSQ